MTPREMGQAVLDAIADGRLDAREWTTTLYLRANQLAKGAEPAAWDLSIMKAALDTLAKKSEELLAHPVLTYTLDENEHPEDFDARHRDYGLGGW